MPEVRIRVASPDSVPQAYKDYISAHATSVPPNGTPAGYVQAVQSNGSVAWVDPSTLEYDGGSF